jgi:hypothetical protein
MDTPVIERRVYYWIVELGEYHIARPYFHRMLVHIELTLIDVQDLLIFIECN